MTTEEFMNWMIKWGNFKARCKSNFSKTAEAKKNKELEDKYKNNRCFIIGNGESIKSQDLSLLADEIVFVTNSFCLYRKGYLDAKPNYYVLVDSLFFREGFNPSLIGEIDMIRNYKDKPAFICPYTAQAVIREKMKWDEWTSVYYLDGGMVFVEGYEKKYDITKVVPSPQCVVQVAMLIATYMGFKEIYLLGIEQTNIIDSIGAYLGKPAVRYAYEVDTDKMATAYVNAVQTRPLEIILKGYARIFQLYKEIYKYCLNQGIKVYNCTPETLVDSIPKISYESLFERGEGNG